MWLVSDEEHLKVTLRSGDQQSRHAEAESMLFCTSGKVVQNFTLVEGGEGILKDGCRAQPWIKS